MFSVFVFWKGLENALTWFISLFGPCENPVRKFLFLFLSAQCLCKIWLTVLENKTLPLRKILSKDFRYTLKLVIIILCVTLQGFHKGRMNIWENVDSFVTNHCINIESLVKMYLRCKFDIFWKVYSLKNSQDEI